MFAVLGNEVIYLKRIGEGAIFLDPALPPGKARELTQTEKSALEI